MEYILSCSGGKDSVATAILAHIYNEPVDKIVFAEVMYSLDREISGENQKHIDFVKNKLKPTLESWGYEFDIVRAEKDYLDCFNHIIERPRKHSEHKGMKNGFPCSGHCGVKRDCKVKPIKDFLKECGEYTQYIGIAIDEPKRLDSLHETKDISLLEKYGYTEEMAKDLCKEYGLLSPTYNLSKRGGCWFCPWAKVVEHEYIKEHFPKLWIEFMELEEQDNLAHDKWNVYKETLKERDEFMKWKDAQMTIYDYLGG